MDIWRGIDMVGVYFRSCTNCKFQLHDGKCEKIGKQVIAKCGDMYEPNIIHYNSFHRAIKLRKVQ